MAWMQSHGNFSHPEVISYELLEGEVFNSKFCINPLEPISMAIERGEFAPRMGCANLEGVVPMFAQPGGVVRISRCCANFAQAWSSCLPKAISSSFQLQIIHSLKRWILDFLSFEMQISGGSRNHFARENGVCEISQTLKRAAKSFRNDMLSSQGCKFGFHLEVPSFPLAVYVGQLQKEIHPTIQKGCGITSQQKGDFAALCKMLPSARSDWLAMAATSSFQLRITHRLKHWIVDFLSFEMVYSMHQLDFRKCSKSGCYDCHQEYASWQILFTFSPCIPDLLLANDFQALPKIPHNSPQS
uniref:Uncharacterized protein n=1 Tax=Vitis vinifera TaxID=29760 RepID=A5AUQ0_VITVI|nr:hypothetical protein VITISV_003832 [Vitis vinifera]